MKESNRIVVVCDTIYELWQHRCPELRFMQLIENFRSWLGFDPFYMEDGKFIEKFREYVEKTYDTYDTTCDTIECPYGDDFNCFTCPQEKECYEHDGMVAEDEQ